MFICAGAPAASTVLLPAQRALTYASSLYSTYVVLSQATLTQCLMKLPLMHGAMVLQPTPVPCVALTHHQLSSGRPEQQLQEARQIPCNA